MAKIKGTHAIILLTSLILSPAWAADIEKPDNTPNVEENQSIITKGKALFDSICIHCHHTTYDASAIGAPGLRGVLERHNEEWINTWLNNPESFAKIDVAARDLVDANTFGLIMPTIPAMQNEDNRRAVIEYLKTLK